MNAKVVWKEGMQFNAVSGDNTLQMDAKSPIGKGNGFTPKELLLAGIAGCTGMDVIALLKKYKQDVRSFAIESQTTPTTNGHPVIFQKVHITFTMEGTIEVEKALEAVKLSQTQYCGVSAMISKTVPIEYEVIINGETVGTGQADFKI